jgi:hypothetical protein
VVLQDIPGQGRGLVAKVPISKGERLLMLPSSVMIDPERAFTGGGTGCTPIMLLHPVQNCRPVSRCLPAES